MKKNYRIINLILCLLLILSLFNGCVKKDEKIDFIYPFNANIKSFDPQIASTQDEYLIIENCFEGLVRVRDDATVIPGVAEAWSISKDGLTYTFNLKQGVKWRIVEDSNITELMGDDFNPDITAHDFVFALQRACDKITNSPLFPTISNIVNANEAYQGKKKLSSIGVRAINDYKLEIKLKTPNESFLKVLSTAVAIPCNEQFFNATKGRYGLGTKYTMFNGQFYISSILEASYILKNNDKYTGSNPSNVSDITLNVINENSDIPKHLKSGYYDCAFISGAEHQSLNDESITVTPYTNKTWAFIINKNRQLFSNKKMRKAIALGVSPFNESEYTYLSSANTLTPPSCYVLNQSATNALGVTIDKKSQDDAKSIWKNALEEEKFTSANITVIAPENMENVTKELVQGIQSSVGSISSYGDSSNISFHLKIQSLNEADYNAAISRGEYDIALYCFNANTDNTISFLNSVVNDDFVSMTDNISKCLRLAQSSSTDKLVNSCKKLEKAILDEYTIIPIAYENSYYAQAKGVSGVDFHAGSGRVCFVNAQREN